MKNFLFNQPYPFERLKRIRISLCCIIITLLTLGPYDSFYVDTAPWLFNGKAFFLNFPNLGIHFWTLKYFVIFLAACVALDYYRLITRPLFAVAYFIFSFYVTCFGTTYWITNTHLIFFSLAICFEPTLRNMNYNAAQKELASFIIAFMITYISVLYFQAGLSKLLLGGWNWFLEGKRIWTETILLGTPFGKWLTKWPWIFRGIGIGTGIFELIFPFFFFFRKTQRWVASIAILFHLGTFVIMGISFWFLWILYPAIFFTRLNPGLNRPGKFLRKETI